LKSYSLNKVWLLTLSIFLIGSGYAQSISGYLKFDAPRQCNLYLLSGSDTLEVTKASGILKKSFHFRYTESNNLTLYIKKLSKKEKADIQLYGVEKGTIPDTLCPTPVYPFKDKWLSRFKETETGYICEVKPTYKKYIFLPELMLDQYHSGDTVAQNDLDKLNNLVIRFPENNSSSNKILQYLFSASGPGSVPGTGSIAGTSDSLTLQMKKAIRALKAGSKIFIDLVLIKDPMGDNITIPGLTLFIGPARKPHSTRSGK
jgi:hypothetical protein